MRIRVAAVGLAILLIGCGDSSDEADGPFVDDWRLDEHPCAEPVAGSQCYTLTLGVSGSDGDREASCVIYALDTAGIEFVLDEATDADPDQGLAYTTIDGFSIQAGDEPSFGVVLPIVDEQRFARWQVTCDPGAPG